jgi:energy-coupling factor transport system substrate-specific component
MIGSPLPMWVYQVEFIEMVQDFGVVDPAFINEIVALANPVTLVLMFAGTIGGAFVGAAMTKVLFKKHFQKAGLV